jgi:hypothetical protein
MSIYFHQEGLPDEALGFIYKLYTFTLFYGPVLASHHSQIGTCTSILVHNLYTLALYLVLSVPQMVTKLTN